ncbi:hypothetical protein ACFL35_02150 [Candidatus Riflebacteria bacterium]
MDIKSHDPGCEENPIFFAYGKARDFRVVEDEKVLAECRVIFNPRLQSEEPTGMVGFYKSENNPEANKLLFEACAEWFRERGLKKIAGPINYSTWYSNRFMTKGFEDEKFPGEPDNPEYYPQLWQECGFSIKEKYFTQRHLHGEEFESRADRLLRSIKLYERKGYYFKNILELDVDKALTKLHPIMEDIFEENRYYAPIELDEFKSIFLPICHPKSPAEVIVAFNKNDEIVGALINLAFPQFPQTHIVKSIGVARAERGAATAHALIAKAVLLGREKGCAYTDSALMHEENMSFRIASKIHGEIIKEYAIFEKNL